MSVIGYYVNGKCKSWFDLSQDGTEKIAGKNSSCDYYLQSAPIENSLQILFRYHNNTHQFCAITNRYLVLDDLQIAPNEWWDVPKLQKKLFLDPDSTCYLLLGAEKPCEEPAVTSSEKTSPEKKIPKISRLKQTQRIERTGRQTKLGNTMRIRSQDFKKTSSESRTKRYTRTESKGNTTRRYSESLSNRQDERVSSRRSGVTQRLQKQKKPTKHLVVIYVASFVVLLIGGIFAISYSSSRSAEIQRQKALRLQKYREQYNQSPENEHFALEQSSNPENVESDDLALDNEARRQQEQKIREMAQRWRNNERVRQQNDEVKQQTEEEIASDLEKNPEESQENIDLAITEKDQQEQEHSRKEKYARKMRLQNMVEYNGRWIPESQLEFEKQREQRWSQEILLAGVWYPPEKLGQWHILLLQGENEKREGFLLEDNEYYRYRNIQGEAQVFAQKNVIYKKPAVSPWEFYWQQRKSIEGDSQGNYQLGLWCEPHFSELAQIQFQKTIFLNPDHAEARAKLGFVRYKDEWITTEEAQKNSDMVLIQQQWMTLEQAKSRGYVQHQGKWLSQTEYIAVKAQQRKQQAIENKNSDQFLTKLFGAKAKKLGTNSWLLEYDFSTKNAAQIQTFFKTRGQKIVVQNDYLEVAAGAGYDFVYVPVLFEGNIDIQYEGQIHPAFKSDLNVKVYDDEEKLGSSGYVFGVSYKEFVSDEIAYNGILSMEGEKTRLITRKTNPKIQKGEWYNIRIKIANSYLRLYINNKLIVNKKHSKFRKGLVGFGTYDSKVRFRNIKIAGNVDPRWFSKATKAVEAVLRVQDNLSGSDLTVSPLAEQQADILADVKSDNSLRLYSQGVSLVQDKKYSRAIKLFDDSINLDRSFPLPYVERAYCYYLLNNLEQAIRDVDKAIALRASYAESYIVKGMILEYQEKQTEAIEEYQKAIKVLPKYLTPYKNLARAYVVKKDYKKAREIAAQAQQQIPDHPKIATLIKGIEMSIDGPKWEKRYEKKTSRYHVMTDISQSFCNDMAARLELLFKEYARIFGEKNLSEHRSRVVIFDSRAEYQEYSFFVSGHFAEHSAGYFSPITKELVLFDDLDRDETIDTLYHEGFHQFIDVFLKTIPTWFNEGLATYFGASQIIGGKLHSGTIPPFRKLLIKSIIQQSHTPLKKLVASSTEEFRNSDQVSTNYTLSWAFIHFLIHGKNGQYRFLIGKYLNALKEGKRDKELYDSVWSKVNFQQLEEEWTEYFANLE